MSPPVLKLDDIFVLSKAESPEHNLCHTFGVFLKEEPTNNSNFWTLADETLPGLRLKLCGNLAEYPKPKAGDVVRIHRLGFDKVLKVPVILHPKNVVFWSASKYNPTPIHSSNKPTINNEDNERRKSLELSYYKSLNKIDHITKIHYARYFNIAGRVDGISRDQFENIVIDVNDGTGVFKLRVFPKRADFESDDHFQVAKSLEKGDLIMATNAKLDNRNDKLNLSANSLSGRSLRILEKPSVIGVSISESLKDSMNSESSQNDLSSARSDQQIVFEDEDGAPPTPKLRRSPRLNSQTNGSQHVSHCTPTINLLSNPQNSSPNNAHQTHQSPVRQCRRSPPLPSTTEGSVINHTKLSNIKRDRDGFFSFYDFVGQVRSQPNETRQYQNWIFQLYDGSKLDYSSFYLDEVKQPVEDCACILVYSKQKPEDTDKHIEAIKKINEGDIVIVKNVKVSWKQDKAKFEMSANLLHGKSIQSIDKGSKFGLDLLERLTNPTVEEMIHFVCPSRAESEVIDVEGL